MTRRPKAYKRNVGIREPANRVLVVTEGTETEPRYFGALLQKLELSTRRIVVKPGSGSDPISVVDTAIREKKIAIKQGSPFDSIWVVFDTERERIHLSDARTKARAHGFNLAISAPCFEYWFLLHFCYTTSYLTCYDDVKRELGRYLPYNKGSFNASLLLENTSKAVDNARKVRADAERTDAQYPRTDVDQLVVEIDGYADDSFHLLVHRKLDAANCGK
jgi:hypothetical protein